jgi:hypothetical protein
MLTQGHVTDADLVPPRLPKKYIKHHRQVGYPKPLL